VLEETREPVQEAEQRWWHLQQRIEQLETELELARQDQKRVGEAIKALEPLGKAVDRIAKTREQLRSIEGQAALSRKWRKLAERQG
jgi:lipid II:glycine glycyltransferase (peptidoglycan interpeptide bridge formation enzyme)